MTDLREWAEDAWRRGLQPGERLSVSEWADRHRVLPPTSAEPGLWRTSRTPFIREPMDSLSAHDPCERVVIMKAAQTAGTECGLNWLGYIMHHAPGAVLVVWPTVDTARRNVRSRIDPLIEGTPELCDLVISARSREKGNSSTLKLFPAGEMHFGGANSAAALRSLPVRFLFLDEVDAYPADVDDEGDPVDLAVKRTLTYRGKRKILMVSTPTIKSLSRIEKGYGASDKRRYHVPCKHCGAMNALAWKDIHWPEGKPEKAYWACPDCGGVHLETDKHRLLNGGEWRPTARGDGRTRGYHISGLMSPFVSWGEIAAEFAAVHKDPPRLQVWVNTALGETWEDREAEKPAAADFLARLEQEDWSEYAPDGVALIAAGVDVQGDRLEIEFVGVGRDWESWSLDYVVLHGDPSRPKIWETLDQELRRSWDHPRLRHPLPVRAACVDSQGHHTSMVHQFCSTRHNRRIWAIKGKGGQGVPPWPKRPPKRRQSHGYLSPFMVGVDGLKQDLYARLKLTEPGPGYCHFPVGRDLEYFTQLTCETPLRKYTKGVAVIEWRKPSPGDRNEALDCRVYAMAAVYGLASLGIRLNREADRLASMPRKADGAPGIAEPGAKNTAREMARRMNRK